VNRFVSVFSQLLQLFPRVEFQRAVKDHRAERHARGFTCWGQFVAMLFCQLGRAKSLREICGGLACAEGKLSHLGITAPKRTTVAYANAHRPWQLYQTLFFQLLVRCQAVAQGRRKFRFKNPLLSLDASVIDLCASVFDWATYRRTKGAVKLHLLLDHDGYLPCYAVITEGRRHEVTVARTLTFPPGTILVMDRGYMDFAWFAELTRQGLSPIPDISGNEPRFARLIFESLAARYATALAQLETYVKGGPVIASIHYKFDPKSTIPHLVVIDGIASSTVYYNDPAAKTGEKTISTADFLKGWKKRFIVIRPAKPVLAMAAASK